jgi:tripartite-type tricarboxylate transporter receptor subunit TctC
VRQLQTKWKNGVVVENRVGASGNIASAYVAKANPDGYTLLVSAGPFSINPSLFKTLPFDTKKDFVPISQISSFASVLLVHESFSAKTLNDFVATAKNPNEPLAYASAGSGTAQHLGMELLRSKLKLNLNHIPYKGGAPAMNDLLAGHVKVMLAGMGDASPHLNTGRVFPLVTTGKARSPLLPTIPTLQELGILDFDASGWCGLHAPAGTPAEIIQRINQDVVAALADPSVRQGMAAMDVDPRPTSVAEFRAFMDSQFAKWKEAVELSGAKAD